MLEDGLVGLNGDGDGLLSKCGFELGCGVGSHVALRAVSKLTYLTLVEGAVAIFSCVLVGCLWLSMVASVVIEGALLSSTIAAIAPLVTVNELLLRDGLKIARLDGIRTLKGPDC